MPVTERHSRASRVSAITGLVCFLSWYSTAIPHEIHDHQDDYLNENRIHNHQNQEHRARDVVASTSVEHHLRRFRETGDDAHLDRARELLPANLDDPTLAPYVLVDAATVAQSRHRFDLALRLVDDAIARAPHDDRAWLLRASLHLVRGNATEAEHACRNLRRVPLLTMLTCTARVALVRGETDVAASRLSALLGAIDGDRMEPALLAWSLSVAGDLFAATDANTAVDYYEQSLALQENAQVRAALVDVLLSDRRPHGADAALAAGAPALPLQVRRMIVAKRLGRAGDVAADVAATDREFQRWIAAKDWLHAREMARFYLDVLPRPALARRLAVINLSQQREPEDLRLEQRTRDRANVPPATDGRRSSPTASSRAP